MNLDDFPRPGEKPGEPTEPGESGEPVEPVEPQPVDEEWVKDVNAIIEELGKVLLVQLNNIAQAVDQVNKLLFQLEELEGQGQETEPQKVIIAPTSDGRWVAEYWDMTRKRGYRLVAQASGVEAEQALSRVMKSSSEEDED